MIFRAASALALLGALAGPAVADPAPAAAVPAPAPSPPDPAAQHAADEANLVSNASRSGVTAALAIVGNTIIGKEVGRGAGLSLRLGHVATPRTIITFEISGGSLLHTPDGGKTTLVNTNANFLAGAQYYVAPSFWLRFSGGLATYAIDDGPLGKSTHLGGAGCIGFGLDFARLGRVVLGAEGFAITSVTSEGPMFNASLGLGVSYY